MRLLSVSVDGVDAAFELKSGLTLAPGEAVSLPLKKAIPEISLTTADITVNYYLEDSKTPFGSRTLTFTLMNGDAPDYDAAAPYTDALQKTAVLKRAVAHRHDGLSVQLGRNDHPRRVSRIAGNAHAAVGRFAVKRDDLPRRRGGGGGRGGRSRRSGCGGGSGRGGRNRRRGKRGRRRNGICRRRHADRLLRATLGMPHRRTRDADCRRRGNQSRADAHRQPGRRHSLRGGQHGGSLRQRGKDFGEHTRSCGGRQRRDGIQLLVPERLFDFLSCIVQTAFHRTERNLQLFGNLVHTLVFIVIHECANALFFGKRPDDLPDAAAELMILRHRLHRRVELPVFHIVSGGNLIHCHIIGTRKFAAVIAPFIQNNAPQPPPEARLVSQLVEAGKGGYVTLLQNILRVIVIAAEMTGEHKRGGIGFLIQRTDRRLIFLDRPLYQTGYC